MTHNFTRGAVPRTVLALLMAGGLLGWASVLGSINPQDKAKTEGKDQKKPQAKDEKKADAKAQAKSEKKAESKPAAMPAPAPVPAPPNPNDSAKLKEQIAALQKEVAGLRLKVATLELEKLGAMVTVDKAKDGKETATVNILKKWSGDKDALQLLKNVPNLQVVYIDNGQVNDAEIGRAHV